MQDQILPTSRV